MHGPQNVANVVLGNLRITPEYSSFYPEDLIGGRKVQWLYVCHWCFRYTHELMKYAAHCVSLVENEWFGGSCGLMNVFEESLCYER